MRFNGEYCDDTNANLEVPVYGYDVHIEYDDKVSDIVTFDVEDYLFSPSHKISVTLKALKEVTVLEIIPRKDNEYKVEVDLGKFNTQIKFYVTANNEEEVITNLFKTIKDSLVIKETV